MPSDDTNKVNSPNKGSHAPETTINDLLRELRAAEGLLLQLETEYQKERNELSKLPPIWFDRNAIVSSLLTLAAVLIVGLSIGFYSNIQFDILKVLVPLSIGVGIIPFIISSARNNYSLQQKNAFLSGKLSEMMNLRSRINQLQQKEVKIRYDMNLRSRINQLQQKEVKIRYDSRRKDLSPLEVRQDAIAWLKKALHDLNSILEIEEYKSGKDDEGKTKAEVILKKVNEEFYIPKWQTAVSTLVRYDVFEPHTFIIYDEYARIIARPDFIDLEKIRELKDSIVTELNEYSKT
jgi:hypothetical protein